jgi:tetratricopeptide (TPR) repeat protein
MVQAMLVGIAMLVYANSIPNQWAVDDSIVANQNRYVQRGAAGLDSIFTTSAFYGFYGININAVAGDRWRPLSPAVFAVAAEIFASPKKDAQQEIVKDASGFKVKDLGKDTLFPHVLHLFNVFWYGLLCLVLYRLLLLLLNPQQETGRFKADFTAAVATLLFAVHPLHTEAVANVKGLDEILALLGALSATFCLLKAWYAQESGDQKTRWKWLGASLAAFFAGLLAKESAVTFLAVIPLALWFFTKASLKNIAVLTAPLLLVFGLFFALRTFVVGSAQLTGFKTHHLMNDPFLVLDKKAQFAPIVEGSDVKKLLNPNIETFSKMPFANQLATNFYTYAVYFKLMVAPYPLTIDYYPRHIAIKSFGDVWVLLSLLLHGFLLIWAIGGFKSRNPLAFGVLYYFATFSVVSNLVFPIGTNMSERFMFMPSVGVCLSAALLLYAASQKWGIRNVLAGTGLLCAVYAALTIRRNPDWKDNYTLFSQDIKVSQNSGKIPGDQAGEMLSKALEDEETALLLTAILPAREMTDSIKAIRQRRDAVIRSAISLSKISLEINPMYGAIWLQFAKANHLLSQTESNTPNQNFTYLLTAAEAYKQADFYKPINSEQTINEFRGICYQDLGKFYGSQLGDIAQSITYLEEAKRLDPKNGEADFLLGTAYSSIKDYEKSIYHTEQSLAKRPNDRGTKENLAAAYQIYASVNPAKKDLLPKAEVLLLNVVQTNKQIPDNDPKKNETVARTLDLLQKNYGLQGKTQQQADCRKEILALYPGFFDTKQ